MKIENPELLKVEIDKKKNYDDEFQTQVNNLEGHIQEYSRLVSNYEKKLRKLEFEREIELYNRRHLIPDYDESFRLLEKDERVKSICSQTDANSIEIKTNPLFFTYGGEKYAIGSARIVLNQTNELEIFRDEEGYDFTNEIWKHPLGKHFNSVHPHVHRYGTPCFGEWKKPIYQALVRGDFYSVVNLTISFLEWCGNEDYYTIPSYWPKVQEDGSLKLAEQPHRGHAICDRCDECITCGNCDRCLDCEFHDCECQSDNADTNDDNDDDEG